MQKKTPKLGTLIKAGLAVAIAAGTYGAAGAHNYGPAYKVADSCSPHGATKSKGGSVFSSCDHAPYTSMWSRDYVCAAGTTCANVQCGGKQAIGTSATDTYHELNIYKTGCL